MKMFCPRSEFPMRLQDSPAGGAPGPASRSVPSSSAGNGRETPGSPLAWRDGRPQAWACCGPCKLGFEMLLPRQEIHFPGPRTQGPSLASTSLMGVHVLGCYLDSGLTKVRPDSQNCTKVKMLAVSSEEMALGWVLIFILFLGEGAFKI